MSDSKNEQTGRFAAIAAIAASQRENRIVHIPYDPDIYEWLLAWSDDSAEEHLALETWGDDEGGWWRVHLDVGKGVKR